MAKKNKKVDVLTALKNVVGGLDEMDTFIFVVLFIMFPPLPIIWLAVRIIQEIN